MEPNDIHSDRKNALGNATANATGFLIPALLSFGCIWAGYGFYRMNHGDWINASVFTIGLLGIMLSVLRNRKKK